MALSSRIAVVKEVALPPNKELNSDARQLRRLAPYVRFAHFGAG